MLESVNGSQFTIIGSIECLFYLHKDLCHLSRSKNLFPLTLIYGFGPSRAETLQVHEVKTLDWGTVIFKARTQKRKKPTGIIYVLIFFLRIDGDLVGTDMHMQKDPRFEHPAKVQQNPRCGCCYQPGAVMPPCHFAKKRLLRKINKFSIIPPSRTGLGFGRCRSVKEINANQTFRKVNTPCLCHKSSPSAG